MSRADASSSPAKRFWAVRLPSDERLAKRAAEGDERAFAAIYKRYHQDLYRFCLAIVRNPQDAQDALQNAMVKALRALPGETRRIQLKPWLYRIARNESIEMLRRRRDSTELDPELAAPGGEPSEIAATRERLQHLFGDLGELPERQRSALVMRELAGLDFEEIGAAFDTSGAVARQTVYEARLSLRQMEAGREMRCKHVMWDLSEADARVARRRDIQAHLRSCPECRAFAREIASRRGDFAAIAPLPLAVSAGLLQGLLGGGAAGAAGAGAGGSLAGAAAVGAGKSVATSAALKAAATAAVVAVGVTAADRGGVIETPLPSSIGGAKSSGPVPGTQAPGETQGDSERGTRTDSARAIGLERNRRKAGVAAADNPKQAARGRDQADGDPLDQVSGEPGTSGRSEARGRGGRSDDLPAASEHGQTKAAGARSPRGPKKKKGRGAASKGAGKPTSPAKGAPQQGPGAKPKAHANPAKNSPGAEVGADKAAGGPFQTSKSQVSKGAFSPAESANPSKEAR